MENRHNKNCSAPICMQQDYNKVVWCAGEEVCGCRPLTELQKKQLRINKEFGKGRFQDSSWTGSELVKTSL